MSAQEVVNYYKSLLDDLTCNNSRLNDKLTMLAEENKAHAEEIVKTIEKHVIEVCRFFHVLCLKCNCFVALSLAFWSSSRLRSTVCNARVTLEYVEC